ncbi:tyrosine recombinase XerS [Secundilactobacillus collinoides]|uniref:Site-specific tyrosine recombinase XerS n=1 Tax=Secundilactobacillus collinoides TaxID=33960 RepID=A0A166GZQ6_SECCO|nr:tyrosine recombinase XerS [Secundilactobacillus collinoides]KZL41073.1 site-specific tyrosine recombinase XerS [Secundilactobacillus collinoides]
MRQADYVKHNEELVAQMPDFIRDYYLTKSTVPLSAATLYQYLNEFHRFFEWLVDTGVSSAQSPAQVSLSDLEHMKKQDMELYKSYLLNRGKQTAKNPQGAISHRTVNRSLNALSALFRFLTEETENQDGEPYFYRNVMKKISLVRDSETYAARANSIKSQLMLGKTDMDYLNFIQDDYADTIKDDDRKLRYFQRDRERDVAINALMLGTGIRVSELENANLKDLSVKQATVSVRRKGGKWDTVPVASWVLPYVTPYLEIRTERYQTTSSTTALFLTKGKEAPRRITTATVELLVSKYSYAFNHVRITPHKLRHTLASKLYLATKNEHLVATQLGQSSTTATGLYTHIIDTKQHEALDELHEDE